MLIQQGEARSSGADLRLACFLAGAAGALNAAGFYAVGLYSANMTGNVSALADHLGIGDLVGAGLFVALVAIFVLGATTSTLLINAGRRRGRSGVYAFSILAEALLLAGMGCVDVWLPEAGRGPLLALGLSFLMGLQNAVVTRISDARVRTTHVTGMVTDIGIELANLVDLRSRSAPEPEVAANRNKLRLHSWTVVSFLVGGIAGVLIYRAIGGLLLFGIAALLLVLATKGLLTGRNQVPRDAPRPR